MQKFSPLLLLFVHFKIFSFWIKMHLQVDVDLDHQENNQVEKRFKEKGTRIK
jgi:hypothetical protein